MRIFFSVGEPSGDIHGANLIRSLRQLHSGVECVGYGGDRMATAGCALHFPLTQLAVMGVSRVVGILPQVLSLISQADRMFRHQRPDAVVLIDYPGFNWWIARRARFHGIPVFYFVPPQIWAWLSWRVAKMRKWVDHVLCSLPFEEDWYRRRGVTARYVGHPFFDELPKQRLDLEYMDVQRRQGGDILGILPGSRTQEVQRNFPTQLLAAHLIHQACPSTRFLVACFKESQQKMVEEMRARYPALPVQTLVKRTPEIIEVSKACIAVSGSVSLELMYRAKPTVIVYRVNPLMEKVIRPLLQTKYITLVNLLADQMLFPEFASDHFTADEVALPVIRWLQHDQARSELCGKLLTLRDHVAQPGACDRTARIIVETLGGR